jgi:hypothetical protein
LSVTIGPFLHPCQRGLDARGHREGCPQRDSSWFQVGFAKPDAALELWFVSDGNGLQIVRFSHWFMAHNKSLFQGSPIT